MQEQKRGWVSREVELVWRFRLTKLVPALYLLNPFRLLRRTERAEQLGDSSATEAAERGCIHK